MNLVPDFQSEKITYLLVYKFGVIYISFLFVFFIAESHISTIYLNNHSVLYYTSDWPREFIVDYQQTKDLEVNTNLTCARTPPHRDYFQSLKSPTSGWKVAKRQRMIICTVQSVSFHCVEAHSLYWHYLQHTNYFSHAPWVWCLNYSAMTGVKMVLTHTRMQSKVKFGNCPT